MTTDKLDPWAAAQQPSYSETKFYTRSRDEKGFSENQQCRFSPNIHGAMGALVAMRQIPDYRTVGDFVRDAVVHRLKKLTVMMDEGDRALDYLRDAIEEELMMADIERAASVRASRIRLLSEAESALKNAWDDRDIPALRELLTQLETRAVTLPPPWYGRIVALIGEYYKHDIGGLMPWKDHPLAAIEVGPVGGQ